VWGHSFGSVCCKLLLSSQCESRRVFNNMNIGQVGWHLQHRLVPQNSWKGTNWNRETLSASSIAASYWGATSPSHPHSIVSAPMSPGRMLSKTGRTKRLPWQVSPFTSPPPSLFNLSLISFIIRITDATAHYKTQTAGPLAWIGE